jgi:hypothetical protein
MMSPGFAGDFPRNQHLRHAEQHLVFRLNPWEAALDVELGDAHGCHDCSSSPHPVAIDRNFPLPRSSLIIGSLR